MGTWGTGPFDNDDAAEFIGSLKADLGSKLQDSRFSDDEGERAEGRAALGALTALHRAGYVVSPNAFDDGQRLLETMLDDKMWISQWRSPAAIRSRLRNDLKENAKISAALRRRFRRR